MNMNIKEILINVIEFGKTIPIEKWGIGDSCAKLGEESGELSEAGMIKGGRLPTKKYKEQAEFEEVADVILCALDILQKVNPNMSSEDILHNLCLWLTEKSYKWKNVQDKIK